MAEDVSRSLSGRRSGFAPVLVHVGFVVDKVELVQELFSDFFGFPLLISFHHDSPSSYIIWLVKNNAFVAQFRDIVSTLRHEKQNKLNSILFCLES
jgi:hypothetical protein